MRRSASLATSQIKERGREPWRWPTVESIFADVSFAIRKLRKSPGFSVTAILTLALGIGANVVVLSVLNGLILRPPDVPQPCACRHRCTTSLLMPRWAASLRQLQCVDPSAGFFRVAARIRAREAGVKTLDGWWG